MPGLLMLGAALMLAPAADDRPIAYPAIQQAGGAYAIAAEAGRITECLPLDPSEDAGKTRTACAALTARGVPAGIEPAIATGTPSDWFPSAEYPADAMRPGTSGSVTLIYEIDEKGAVTSCLISKSSGLAKLDQAACAGLIRRGHFSPASYNGKPVHAAAIARFSYERQ